MLVQSLQEACPRRAFSQDNREALFLQTSGNPLHRRLEVTGHASCVVFGEVVVLSESRTRTSDDDCPNLPHLQEISEHGAMGQPYAALLLRPVHPTAATERTDGVIRLDKSKVRP
jgi:hypothetical protein